ncbi:MAG: thymidine phosphorylase [Eubacteriales bacterium]|nr:thymidine phosphorylase [Eubacteriales bacterium]
MTILDLIEKKKNKIPLTKEEIEFFVNGVVSGEIKDYQTSAFLMAVVLNSMTKEETFYLTDAMKNSGDVFDFSEIKGTTVDKHSTGGVGDSTTFVTMPILAALGFKVAKMSGRGLGFTGGTLDKLESFDGLNVFLEKDEFIKQVNDISIAVCGQTGNICPADKILYALRDVTGTVDSIPLIASSIMSKKLAVAADILVLDVKTGDGSLLGDLERTKELASLMVEMGKMAGKRVSAVITSMDEPLDNYIGNNLEVLGATEVLSGAENELKTVAKALAVEVLMQSGMSEDKASSEVERVIKDGSALEIFKTMLVRQGAKNLEIKKPKICGYEIKAQEDGYLQKVRTKELGKFVMSLGGGRMKKDDTIDHTVGLKVLKRVGDSVAKGETIALLYANDEAAINRQGEVLSAFIVGEKKAEKTKLIVDKVG